MAETRSQLWKAARLRLLPEWAGLGREEGAGERAAGMKKANWAESEEEKGRENISFIFFQINFPNDFQIEFEFNSNFSQS